MAEISKSLKNYVPHELDLLFDMPVPYQALLYSTDLSEEQICGEVEEEEVVSLYEAVKGVNPTLAGMMARLGKMGGILLNAQPVD